MEEPGALATPFPTADFTRAATCLPAEVTLAAADAVPFFTAAVTLAGTDFPPPLTAVLAAGLPPVLAPDAAGLFFAAAALGAEPDRAGAALGEAGFPVIRPAATREAGAGALELFAGAFAAAAFAAPRATGAALAVVRAPAAPLGPGAAVPPDPRAAAFLDGAAEAIFADDAFFSTVFVSFDFALAAARGRAVLFPFTVGFMLPSAI